ncbi:hypothetical protein Ae707Ps1_6278c [Pseudonocardia sp. Ae707_Ps1]|nr:hypothetical protein Ae707Ps1_6262c [Pseudonocardia sp. Ae707_Ps1]OLM08765.1 hypothetical protein Ae707Ps1_6278c [Pseudonocardia sp. Ae707_Ps1]
MLAVPCASRPEEEWVSSGWCCDHDGTQGEHRQGRAARATRSARHLYPQTDTSAPTQVSPVPAQNGAHSHPARRK